MQAAAAATAVTTPPARRFSPALAILGLAMALFMLLPAPARAGELDAESCATSSGKDIMLGVFFNSDTDWTNSIYASYDGESFYRISQAYKGAGPGIPYLGAHYAQVDPSIIYHDGYFWSLSGLNNNDGKIWVMISYSKDLVHWTHPEANFSGNGIAVDSYPVNLKGKTLKKFDTVAPDWFISSDGDIYIVVSAGYFGLFHGKFAQDSMQAYSIKVTELSASDGTPAEGSYLWPRNLVFKTEKAKKLSFTNYASANFIDGSFYNDNGTDYLIIKKDGLTNQIYKNADIGNAKGWKLVNSNASFGSEGPTVAKLGGKYHLYVDNLTRYDGIYTACSSSMKTKSTWSKLHKPQFIGPGGKTIPSKHGSVVTLKAASEGWKVAKKLLDSRLKKVHYAPKAVITSATSASRSFKVAWKKKSNVSKYQVRYAASSTMENAKVVNVSSKKTARKVSNLLGKKKYYVQVRTAKKIGGAINYSAWSAKKVVKTKA